MNDLLIVITVFFLSFLALGVFLYGIFSFKKERLKRSLGLKLLLVRLPSPSATDKETSLGKFKEEINLSEQLFNVFSAIKEGVVFEAAVHHIGEEIHFYLAVPEKDVSFVSRQIEGIFKDSQVELAPEYNIFQPQGYSAGFYLKQDKHYSLMLRTYLESEVDTFSPILSGLSRLNQVGEGAAIQLIIRPAAESYKKSIFEMINQLRKGESFKKVSSESLIDLKEISEAINPEEEEKKKSSPSIVDETSIKELEKKVSKPLFEINYRVVVSSLSQYQTERIMEAIAGSFSQFEAPLKNKIKIVKVKNLKKLAYQFSFREFDESQKMILNTEELAGVFHFPTTSTLSPRVKWLKSKEVAPPPNLPSDGTKIGESVFNGVIKPVYITEEDRRRHVYIIGQTGTGKTALITNMALDDIQKGKGVAVMDPHGELAEKLLALIPPQRIDDVIYFDPANVKKPVGLNMLEYDFDKPEQKTFIVNEMLSIFDKLYDLKATGGPMFEQYMRNALLLLMEDAVNEPATLMEVPRVFSDDLFRRRKLARINNPVVIDFWEKEAIRVGGEASLANITPYITSKFNNFIANDYMRPIIGQVKSSFNFRKIMDEGKIFLINLAKGRVGEINANLLGMIIIGKILMAAFSRIDVPDKERKDFNLYIDEFQNFTTDSVASILAEARKFHLNLVVANQYIKQLPEKIRDAVFGNVGSIISFRVGADDAEYLVKQFEPEFSQNDLINLDNLRACVKILINGQTSKPFNIRTPLYPPSDYQLAEKIKEISFLKYGTEREIVEKEILLRLRE
ncbi:MAG: hypothetical protein KatS3mg098_411 [Candidatus Parcubacteria bacterium]|nr:type IV secretory system conjugative DNA transfer family protein [Patescibacteria group bacterium]BCX16182.1 MAG: hypothetical protein KatS3mg098_411 [Candidatus Parcubacteria bacterium]